MAEDESQSSRFLLAMNTFEEELKPNVAAREEEHGGKVTLFVSGKIASRVGCIPTTGRTLRLKG